VDVDSIRLIGRFARVLVIVLGHALLCLPGAIWWRLRAGRRAAGRHVAQRVPRLLVALGPAFVKGGQVLSTRADLLPAHLCESLESICDRVSSQSRERPFDPRLVGLEGFHVDPAPVGAGSIAMVYRGSLPDGRAVAVKVRRTGVAEQLRRDIALVQATGRLMARLPGLHRVPVVDMLDQVGSAVLRQVDFDAERLSLAALARNLGDCAGVQVPHPLGEHCGEAVIVMEFVPELRHLDAARLSAGERQLIAARILAMLYRMLFVDGLVHCDLHAGNLCLGPNGRVVILDAGFVVRLPDRIRHAFARFFLNMALGRGERCADIVIESAAGLSDRTHLEEFRREIAVLVAGCAGARAVQFSLVDFAARLFDLQRRHGLYCAPEFAFPLLSLLMVEGRIRELDATMDFQAHALPVLLRALTGSAPVSR
jgi:ubiquinone biosynthesis protein